MQTGYMSISKPFKVYVFMENIKLICITIFPHELVTTDWKVLDKCARKKQKVRVWIIFVSGSGENNSSLCSLHGVSRDQNGVISPALWLVHCLLTAFSLAWKMWDILMKFNNQMLSASPSRLGYKQGESNANFLLSTVAWILETLVTLMMTNTPGGGLCQ